MEYELHDWRLSEHYTNWVARSAVYNDHRFFDGQRIRISVVTSITPGNVSMDVVTKNSTYTCPYVECSDSTLNPVNDVALISAGLLPSEGEGVQLPYLATEERHTQQYQVGWAGSLLPQRVSAEDMQWGAGDAVVAGRYQPGRPPYRVQAWSMLLPHLQIHYYTESEKPWERR